MPGLTVPDLPDDVFERLVVRAGKNGRSIEAEAVAILAAACAERERPRLTPEEAQAAAKRLRATVDTLYGGRKPKNVVDDLIADRRREAAREASE